MLVTDGMWAIQSALSFLLAEGLHLGIRPGTFLAPLSNSQSKEVSNRRDTNVSLIFKYLNILLGFPAIYTPSFTTDL